MISDGDSQYVEDDLVMHVCEGFVRNRTASERVFIKLVVILYVDLLKKNTFCLTQGVGRLHFVCFSFLKTQVFGLTCTHIDNGETVVKMTDSSWKGLQDSKALLGTFNAFH